MEERKNVQPLNWKGDGGIKLIGRTVEQCRTKQLNQNSISSLYYAKKEWLKWKEQQHEKKERGQTTILLLVINKNKANFIYDNCAKKRVRE